MTPMAEPLNTQVDHPGYHMSTGEHAFSVLRTIGNERIEELFDLYHQQITEGRLSANVQGSLKPVRQAFPGWL